MKHLKKYYKGLFLLFFFEIGMATSLSGSTFFAPVFHGDLHQRILELTASIEQYPDSSELYLKRGTLLLEHEDYAKSIVDFKIYEHKSGVSDVLQINLCKAYLKSDQLVLAAEQIDGLLAKNARSSIANKLKGRIFVKERNFKEAAIYFTKVIESTTKKIPENYFELCDAYERIGDEQNLNNSVTSIESGISELGDLIVFRVKLVDLYVRLNDLGNSLKHQNRIIEHFNRKEKAYFKRAKIYKHFGKEKEALADAETALEIVKELPARIYSVQAMLNLMDEIQLFISKIKP